MDTVTHTAVFVFVFLLMDTVLMDTGLYPSALYPHAWLKRLRL